MRRSRTTALAGEAIQRRNQLSSGRYVDGLHFVGIYAYMGEAERALEYLERCYADRSYWMTTLRVRPVVNSLRGDPRFDELLRRMNLE
jgi:hypothetical protein